jgi:hypothetical protein
MAGEPVRARRLGRIGRTWRWIKRNRVVTALLAATILTLFLATVVSAYQAHRAERALYASLLQEMKLTRVSSPICRWSSSLQASRRPQSSSAATTRKSLPGRPMGE